VGEIWEKNRVHQPPVLSICFHHLPCHIRPDLLACTSAAPQWITHGGVQLWNEKLDIYVDGVLEDRKKGV
jgi:hypothetical protein